MPKNLVKKFEVIDGYTIKYHANGKTRWSKGMSGGNREIPAPGYTFKTAPELNEKLYQEYKDIEWDEILKRLKTSHNKLMKIIKKHLKK